MMFKGVVPTMVYGPENPKDILKKNKNIELFSTISLSMVSLFGFTFTIS